MNKKLKQTNDTNSEFINQSQFYNQKQQLIISENNSTSSASLFKSSVNRSVVKNQPSLNKPNKQLSPHFNKKPSPDNLQFNSIRAADKFLTGNFLLIIFKNEE